MLTIPSAWRHGTLAIGLLALGLQAIGSEVGTAASVPSDDWTEVRDKTFTTVWETVNESYYDATFGGVDWVAVREKYRARLPETTGKEELRQLLQAMLGELRRTHFAIMPRETAVFTPAERVRMGTVGAEVVFVEGVVAVSAIKVESAAARAGLHPGDTVLRIDNLEMSALDSYLRQASFTPARCGLYLTQLVSGRLRSAVGAKVMLAVRGTDGTERNIELTCETNEGPWSEPMGDFPSMPVECTVRHYSASLAYLHFNIFARQAMKDIRALLQSLPADGELVLDLRGNIGGISLMAPGISGWLSDRQYLLGTMHLRQGHIGFSVEPQEGAFLGPMAVLIDSGSASTSEIMAAGLQEAGRARIFGENSPGAALPSLFKALPTGDLLQYAVADMQTPRGILIEGRGVAPDEPVLRTLADLATGRDPVLEAAQHWLESERRKSPRFTPSQPPGIFPMTSSGRTKVFPRLGRYRPWLLVTGLLLSAMSAADTKEDEEKKSRAVLIRWLEALGGAHQIQQLKTVDYHCKISYGPSGPSIETYARANAAGAYRYDYELPIFGRLTQAYDGQSVWQKNDVLGFGPQSASEHAQNLTGVDFRAPLRVGSLYPERKLLPDETVEGRRLQVLAMVDSQGGQSKWYFDPVTGLRVRIEIPITPDPVVIEYSDFRRVQGIQEPFHTIRKVGGRVLDITMLSILYNEGADPALFAPPVAWLDDNRAVEHILHYNGELTGSAAFRQVRTRVTKALTEITTAGMKISTTISQKRPNLTVCEQEVPGMGTVWQGYNGQVGWAWSELQGYRNMQGAELQQMLGSADMEGPLHLRELCPLRRLLEEREENGRRIVGIALATLQGPAGNFYFDTKTYYLVRVETFIQAGPSGQLKVVADFSDFRNVDGMMMPFVTIVTNPAMRMVTTIESVKHNVPLDDALFQPRKN